MSKRWTSIVAGITLTIAVFLNFISEIVSYVYLYRMAGSDFVAVAGVNLFLTVLFTVADVLVVVGAFSNKLGLPMILGTGIWTFTAILNTFIRLVQTRGFSVGDFFLSIFTTVIPTLVPTLICIMVISTLITKRRVTNLIVVVPVLNFVAGFVNLVISCVYMMPMDFFELFKTIFVPTSIMMIYTVAYLFLSMFIEGKGIAYEREKSLQ